MKNHAAAKLQPHGNRSQLLFGFFRDDNGVNLGDLLVFRGNLDFEFVFAFLQGQILRQFHGCLRVKGAGGNLDFFYILVSIGIQLVFRLVLVEALDGGTAVDPQGHQIGIVAELITTEAAVIVSILRIYMRFHTDFAAAGAFQPVIVGVAAVAVILVLFRLVVLGVGLFLVLVTLVLIFFILILFILFVFFLIVLLLVFLALLLRFFGGFF